MIFLDKALSFYLILPLFLSIFLPLFLSIFLHNLILCIIMHHLMHHLQTQLVQQLKADESSNSHPSTQNPKHPRPSEGTRKLLSMFLGSHGTGLFPMALKPRPAPPSHPNGYEVSRPEVVSNLTPEEAEEAKKIKARSSLEHLELAVGWQMFSQFLAFLSIFALILYNVLNLMLVKRWWRSYFDPFM